MNDKQLPDQELDEVRKLKLDLAAEKIRALEFGREREQIILDINEIIWRCYDILTPIGKTASNDSFVNGAVMVLRALQGYIDGYAAKITVVGEYGDND